LIAKRPTLRPLSNSDSDVRDYSGDGMKSSASSIVSFPVMGTIAGDDGPDLTFGQEGDDIIDGNGAADTLLGGDGAAVETIDESFTLSATLLSGLDV